MNNKKFTKSKKIDDYEVLTDDGWVDIDAIHETIPYDVFHLKTNNNELYCADNHILYNSEKNEIFVKNLKVGDFILGENGLEEIILLEKLDLKENMYDLELNYKSNKRYYTNGLLSHNTTFLRYLSTRVERNIIFIPPDMVEILTQPSFIPFLLDNPDTVLIIEDAESALQKRDNNEIRTGQIANILNMTDGLLSDLLNISIVATFNTQTKNLDDALLRKGRLLGSYEFTELSVEKAQKIMNELGKDIKVTKPMSLSDIYYYDEKDPSEYFKKDKNIGFSKK